MKWRMGWVAVSVLALGAASPAIAQHAAPVGEPDKSDVHVAQLYALVKQVHAAGIANADHVALMAKLNAIADAHALETGADKATMEAHIQQIAHHAVMAAETNPHTLDTLDTFWAGIHEAAPAAPAAHAATRSLQDDASWRSDPHMHTFYELSARMLAPGKKLDRAAYEAQARDIFNAFAIARGVDPKAMQDHLKAIPGQMIQIARDDPKVLQSYDAFVVALMGPE